MQSKPISDLPEAASVAAGDTAVIVQDGVTKRVTAERLAGGGAALYATAAQGAKADTAQQPPAEGAFVDGDKTKIDGIEAGADVTDTANVTAAGALMDSEVTNLAAVKAFDPADYATAAQGSTADTAVQPGDNANTLGSGAATDGFVLKADGAGGAEWEEAGGYPDFTGNAGKALLVNPAADGVIWDSIEGDAQTFTTSGTWTKPDGVTFVRVECIGAGGGGFNNTATSAGGGGGGEYVSYTFLASDLSATETVTIGAGGLGGASGSANAGSNGGSTTFGAHLTAIGGNAPTTLGRGGTPGRARVTQQFSDPYYVDAVAAFGGGGGSANEPGQPTMYGGGGGGDGSDKAGGASEFHGAGGTGNATASTKGGNGSAPGGGGGGSNNDGGGGDGARGECRVTSW